MKSLLILFILLPALAFASGSLSNGDIMKKETVKIRCNKMHCEGCKATITEALQSMDGITKFDIDLKTKIIKVTFDNTKTDKLKISEKILESGYENEIIS